MFTLYNLTADERRWVSTHHAKHAYRTEVTKWKNHFTFILYDPQSKNRLYEVKILIERWQRGYN